MDMKCIYSKFIDNNGIIIYLYVDDLVIFGINIDIENNPQKSLAPIFDIKDMDEADIILGIRVIRKNDCIILL